MNEEQKLEIAKKILAMLESRRFERWHEETFEVFNSGEETAGAGRNLYEEARANILQDIIKLANL